MWHSGGNGLSADDSDGTSSAAMGGAKVLFQAIRAHQGGLAEGKRPKQANLATFQRSNQ